MFSRGGFRMCSDSCSGEANVTALRCKVKRSGAQLCHTAQDVQKARDKLPDDYGDLFDDSDDDDDDEDGLESTAPSGSNIIGVSGKDGTGNAAGVGGDDDRIVLDKDSDDDEEGNGSSLTGWLVGGGCVCFCGVMVALAGITMRRKSRKEEAEAAAAAAAAAVAGEKGIEMSLHMRSRTEYWVPPPPTPGGDGGSVDSTNPLFHHDATKSTSASGNVSSLAATKKKRRRRKRPGEMASQVSTGFAEFRNTKRASTFDKFRLMRGLGSNTALKKTNNPVKKRGPSMMNVGRSDWDAFHSEEHNCEYYHNRKTGETRWTTPPEVLAKLSCGGGGNAAATATAARKASGELHIAVALKTAAPNAKVGMVQPDAVAAMWKAFSSETGTYYCNSVTQEVSWVLPAGATLEGEGGGEGAAAGLAAAITAGGSGGANRAQVGGAFLHSSKRKELEKEFTEYQTEDGHTAYHNTKTGEVSWVNPYKACAEYKPDLTALQFGVCAACGFKKTEHGGK